ncbi:HlyC/CorC family transporter [bacterium]|nr:HlyC/CorC family transporter [candidate division CSSED10-310 bacterium]
MNHVFALVLYILAALIFSFLCSISEAVLLSMSPAYIAGLQQSHPGRSRLFRRLKHDQVDRSLAAILTLNTIANTAGAIGAGAEAIQVFGNQWFGVFSAVLTLLILFLSEIIPKTLGALHWRSLAYPAALFIRFLVALLYPVIRLSERLTIWMTRRANSNGFTRVEIAAIAEEGERSGILEASESQVIRNLLRFRCLRAEDIMTPRTVIDALPNSIDVGEAVSRITQSPFSRFPIYRTGLDDIFGFVLRNDLMKAHAAGMSDVSIDQYVRPLENVTQVTALSTILEMFLQKRIQLALVLDEYGGTGGLVTFEDVVETLLGMEIVDEQDTIEDMRKLARETWRRRQR